MSLCVSFYLASKCFVFTKILWSKTPRMCKKMLLLKQFLYFRNGGFKGP